jgi:hypothetical protein
MNPKLLRPRQAGGFDPRTVSNLALWLDASNAASVSLDGSNLVQQWSDLSGNGINATQTVSNNRPDYSQTLNGRKVVSFNGVNTSLEGTAPVTGGTSRTVFCVFRNASTASNVALLGLSSNSGNGGLWYITGEIAVRVIGGNRLFGGGAANTWQSIALTQDGNSTSNMTLKLNGAAVSATSTTAQVVNSGGSMTLGRISPSTGLGAGDIAELLVYSRALSASETAAVENYLFPKWAV